MSALWHVEFHLHTRASTDGWTRPEDVGRLARQRGLHRVFVTDHNTLAGARRAMAASDLVLPGLELKTQEGEFLAYFVREPVPAGLPPLEALEALREQGAFIALPHPTDPWRGRWQEDTLRRVLPLVDAVEVWNGRTRSRRANQKAAALARTFGKLRLVGSDAHLPVEIGRCRVLLPPFSDPESLAQALRHAVFLYKPSPLWVHLGSRLATLMHKLGLWRA